MFVKRVKILKETSRPITTYSDKFHMELCISNENMQMAVCVCCIRIHPFAYFRLIYIIPYEICTHEPDFCI